MKQHMGSGERACSRECVRVERVAARRGKGSGNGRERKTRGGKKSTQTMIGVWGSKGGSKREGRGGCKQKDLPGNVRRCPIQGTHT
jgi:hypothetical protein